MRYTKWSLFVLEYEKKLSEQRFQDAAEDLATARAELEGMRLANLTLIELSRCQQFLNEVGKMEEKLKAHVSFHKVFRDKGA